MKGQGVFPDLSLFQPLRLIIPCAADKLLTIWDLSYIIILRGENMPEFEVEFYEKENGEQPAKEFLLSLDIKMRAKMVNTISILADNGFELREPYSKHLSEGIFELRAKVGSDITRVLYFFYVYKHIILTNGFVKKTQKTPPGEIEKAKKYRADYLRRKENGK